MRKDRNKHRRQAAWVCFEPYLTEPQLLQAIETLEQGYQADSVSNLIAYVRKICGDYGIGEQIRKSLYAQFHELMSQEEDVLIDPWDLVVAGRQTQAVSDEATLLRRPEDRAAPPTRNAGTMPGVVEPVQAAPQGKPEWPAEVAVFIGFIEKIVDWVPDQRVFFDGLKQASKKQPKMLQNIRQWSEKPAEFVWTAGLNERAMAEFSHLVYAVLCELVGPVEADLIFHKALAKCEQMPEARHFSPTRFL